MERIDRHNPLQQAAILRLLLAAAVSISLHGVAAWFVPGPVFQAQTSIVRAHIAAPFADSLAAMPGARRHAGSKPVPDLDRGRRSDGLASIDPVDATYYQADELDMFPAPRSPILPLDEPASGYIRVLVRIDASGRVTATRIYDSRATAAEESLVMRAISRTLFVAARRNGQRVRSEVVIEVDTGAQ